MYDHVKLEETHCEHCGQRATKAEVTLLDFTGNPTGGKLSVQVTCNLFGVSGHPEYGYDVTHLPTTYRMASGLLTVPAAVAFCKELARNAQAWKFTTMEEFNLRKAELRTLWRAALEKVGIAEAEQPTETKKEA